ncbi:hypothetical protein VCRA2113O415_50090 [Vibrio crassostreae]|nr:hypothetical protein VCRA2113O415_50090 [Vibrio crassostreae]CAK2753868.1 hypothetical protein VCRA2113O420_20118 [Vibrio crassostreae]CAK3370615.1 hypothetical protein VCRA2121O436_20187 [Vibrio crassostreae]
MANPLRKLVMYRLICIICTTKHRYDAHTNLENKAYIEQIYVFKVQVVKQSLVVLAHK